MLKNIKQALAKGREPTGPLSGKQLAVGERVVKVDRLLGEGASFGRLGAGCPSAGVRSARTHTLQAAVACRRRHVDRALPCSAAPSAGGFATIYRCTDVESGDTYALKYFMLTCAAVPPIGATLRCPAAALVPALFSCPSLTLPPLNPHLPSQQGLPRGATRRVDGSGGYGAPGGLPLRRAPGGGGVQRPARLSTHLGRCAHGLLPRHAGGLSAAARLAAGRLPAPARLHPHLRRGCRHARAAAAAGAQVGAAVGAARRVCRHAPAAAAAALQPCPRIRLQPESAACPPTHRCAAAASARCRDLKAENVLLAPGGRWVLCDFGSASTRHGVLESAHDIALEEEVVRRYTTPAYRAPEVRCGPGRPRRRSPVAHCTGRRRLLTSQPSPPRLAPIHCHQPPPAQTHPPRPTPAV